MTMRQLQSLSRSIYDRAIREYRHQRIVIRRRELVAETDEEIRAAMRGETDAYVDGARVSMRLWDGE